MIRLVSSWRVWIALPIIALSGCVQDVTGADCPTEGFFAVPGDCTRFYRCVRSSAGPFQVLFTFCNMAIFKDPTSIAFSTFLETDLVSRNDNIIIIIKISDCLLLNFRWDYG